MFFGGWPGMAVFLGEFLFFRHAQARPPPAPQKGEVGGAEGEDPHPRKAAGAGLQGVFHGASPPVPRTGTDPFPCTCPALWPPQTCLACTLQGLPSGRKVPPLHVQVRWEALQCRSPGQALGTPHRSAALHVQRLFPAGPPDRY